MNFYLSSAKKFGIDEVGPAVINLVSHAVQERLRDMVSKLSTIAEHRMEIYKVLFAQRRFLSLGLVRLFFFAV